jgi:UDP-glucuronate 4-epimerase
VITRRYLVTGCAGFIGSHLGEALLARGNEVTGIDIFTNYYARSAKERNVHGLTRAPGFSLVEADLATEPLHPLLERVDGVFHLAAQPGVRGSWGETFGVYVRDNVVVTQRLFEAAARLGVRVVLASSSSVYGNAEAYPTREDVRPRPVSPYGVTKLACESLAVAYAESAALDFVALRYFTVYGPRQRPDMAFTRIATALATGTTFTVYGSGHQTRDVTYVADAVRATCLAMDRAPSRAIYNVGGGSETSLRTAIDVCERLADRPLDVRYTGAVQGDARRTAADTSLIRDELGWVPATSLEQGVRAQLEWAGVATGAGSPPL